MNNNEVFELDVRDSDYGVVVNNCDKGIFIKLSNGEYVFSYFSGLEVGTKVFCTVLKRKRNNLKTLVSVDSIVDRYDFAA